MINENELIAMQIKNSTLSEEEFFALEILAWQGSEHRKNMLDGKRYYKGDHDILRRERTAIGKNGELEVVKNLPNNRIVDNRFARLLDQKKNYLLGKALTFRCNDDEYYVKIQEILDNIFLRDLKLAGEESLIGGIAWLYPYVNDYGKLKFKVFPAHEICPFWKDNAHTELDCVARVYKTEAYVGRSKKDVINVEIYKTTGITSYVLESGVLTKQSNEKAYLNFNGQNYNWQTLPIIPIKANSKEIPLIKKVRQLQDALNLLISDFVNNMEENVRDSILVLKNYDGTDLGEFRKNLSCYGAIKTRTQEGSSGGVDVLRVEVNAENYNTIIQMLVRAITQNARGFEARDEKINSSNVNEMSIQTMYSDIDLDANDMECELQAAFTQIFSFINVYLIAFNNFNIKDKAVEVIFNRDILINESEAIDNCLKSKDMLSKETLIAQHPWVKDLKWELDNTTW